VIGRANASLLKRFSYYLSFITHYMVGRPLPVVAGLSLTDICNLNCLHCWRNNTGNGNVLFTKVFDSLNQLYCKGARYLYIQGGEPFSWKDSEKTLQDVVVEARKIGFFHIAICTNGTFPLDPKPDAYSISLDGTPESHNRIRCGTFELVFVNATFNRKNMSDLRFLAQLVSDTDQLQGIAINFHVPYPGVEDLSLTQAERALIAQQAIKLKMEGFPILNTKDGLRALEKNDWKRPLAFSIVTDCERYYSCCRMCGNQDICTQCGYGGWAELSLIQDWNYSSIIEMIRKIHR